MTKSIQVLGLSALTLSIFSFPAQSKLKFETSVDPSGCVIEHVAAEKGMRHFQFDSLSGDGRKLAIGWDRGEGVRGTYILDLKTGERTDVPGFNNGAAFSPDGLSLVNSIYVENGKTDVAEYDLKTGETTIVAPHPHWEWLASYSSDGGTILFNSYRTGSSDIYTFTKATGELRQWTNYEGYEAHGQFSPDDSKIMFHRQVGDGDFNIHVIDTLTGEISQLTDASGEESSGSWSPDGTAIAFSSDRSQEPGTGDIFIMDLDGGNVRQLTDFAAKDGYPFFSPDGKYLYFNSYREPEGVYRIALDEGFDCLRE